MSYLRDPKKNCISVNINAIDSKYYTWPAKHVCKISFENIEKKGQGSNSAFLSNAKEVTKGDNTTEIEAVFETRFHIQKHSKCL